jgi:NAD-dependent deacetylase
MKGYQRFKANPKVWWERRLNRSNEVGELRGSIRRAEPNPGHYALAELEEMGLLKSLITQNIDNLHRVAGSRNIIEIHGNSYKLRCISCHNRFERETFMIKVIPPRCPKCGGLVKGDTVMFGEPIPPDVLKQCFEETSKCDCMLVVGTSGIVHPAASLPLTVKQTGGIIIEVNPLETELTILCDIILRNPSEEALPKLVKELRKSNIVK